MESQKKQIMFQNVPNHQPGSHPRDPTLARLQRIKGPPLPLPQRLLRRVAGRREPHNGAQGRGGTGIWRWSKGGFTIEKYGKNVKNGEKCEKWWNIVKHGEQLGKKWENWWNMVKNRETYDEKWWMIWKNLGKIMGFTWIYHDLNMS